MINEEKIRDLADQICRLDIPFDPEVILAIVRAHVAVVPAGPRIPIVVRPVEAGRVEIWTIKAFAANYEMSETDVAVHVPTQAAMDAVEGQVPRSWMSRLRMSHMQNLGTADEPRYVIALPPDAVCQML